MKDEKIIFHYTSLDKFKCILKYETLRFKESTTSNDVMDTTLLFEVLKEYKGNKNSDESVEAARKFILDYYQKFAAQNQHISLVSCFAEEGDSRMLWDAYTMNRPSNIPCKYKENRFCFDSDKTYNGVCIGFNKKKLEEHIKTYEGKVCERAYLYPIQYGVEKAKRQLNNWFSEACVQVKELSKEHDQSQDLIAPIVIPRIFTDEPWMEVKLRKSLVLPTIDLISKVDAFSPFFKHEFWSDENEIRASLCFHKGKIPKLVEKAPDGMYFDMPITLNCIEFVILGPEFTSTELNEITTHTDYKLDFEAIDKKPSIGTGIIRSK